MRRLYLMLFWRFWRIHGGSFLLEEDVSEDAFQRLPPWPRIFGRVFERGNTFFRPGPLALQALPEREPRPRPPSSVMPLAVAVIADIPAIPLRTKDVLGHDAGDGAPHSGQGSSFLVRFRDFTHSSKMRPHFGH